MAADTASLLWKCGYKFNELHVLSAFMGNTFYMPARLVQLGASMDDNSHDESPLESTTYAMRCIIVLLLADERNYKGDDLCV